MCEDFNVTRTVFACLMNVNSALLITSLLHSKNVMSTIIMPITGMKEIT